jgi:hypothetical protein
MYVSMSTKDHPICFASRRPMVVLPHPI